MLIFLDKDKLEQCFYMLNQYIPSQLKNQNNIFLLARELRAEYLRNYRGSFQEVFMKANK